MKKNKLLLSIVLLGAGVNLVLQQHLAALMLVAQLSLLLPQTAVLRRFLRGRKRINHTRL
ncbi:hypothetical protein [Rothia sp. P7208]|uniref:hypothetical protein n=1 Tax=Rothia sp. P7208 TaxID=3402660 RepID=UPI003AC72586